MSDAPKINLVAEAPATDAPATTSPLFDAAATASGVDIPTPATTTDDAEVSPTDPTDPATGYTPDIVSPVLTFAVTLANDDGQTITVQLQDASLAAAAWRADSQYPGLTPTAVIAK